MAQTLQAPEPINDQPLLPFEERTLSILIAQFRNTPPRIRDAFLEHITALPGFNPKQQ
jgi:hypothetical protein